MTGQREARWRVLSGEVTDIHIAGLPNVPPILITYIHAGLWVLLYKTRSHKTLCRACSTQSYNHQIIGTFDMRQNIFTCGYNFKGAF